MKTALLLLMLWQPPNIPPIGNCILPTRIEGCSYPILGYQAKIAGNVKLSATISANGTPVDIVVISGHRILAKAAVENLQKWKFGLLCTITPDAPTAVLTYEFRLGNETSSRPKSTFAYEHPLRVVIWTELPRLVTSKESLRSNPISASQNP